MSDREIFIIEDTETKLIDGYYLRKSMAVRSAASYARKTGHSMEVKLMKDIEWMDRQITEDGKLLHLEDDVMIKFSEAYNHGTIHRSDKLDAQVKRLQARVRDKLDGITFDDERDEGITPSTPPA